MTYNAGKLIIAGILALALILAIVFGDETTAAWAVPLLTLLIGYVIGNAQVTDQTGAVRPIAATKPLEDPPEA